MTNEELKKQFDLNDPYQIAKYIKAVEKSTPVKAYVRGYLRPSDLAGYEYYGDPSACIIIGEAGEISALLDAKTGSISSVRIECDRRNSAIPLLNLTEVDARIEPGSFIREGAHIHKNAVVMMGAVINIGAVSYTHLDVYKRQSFWRRRRPGCRVWFLHRHPHGLVFSG